MKNKRNSICSGTGLVALDVILNGSTTTPPKYFAGGSCGNVLTILSYMGWKSFPISRLSKNQATNFLLQDLKKWRVNDTLISQSSDGSTPIIIHRILKDKLGNPKHRFEFKNPEDKTWLPGYKPLLSKGIEDLKKSLPKSKVFYFDRVNRASIELAKINFNNGALVFFEPSSTKEEKLFNEALQYSHIVKVSSERINDYSKKYKKQQCILEIETLGKNGLNFRYSKNKSATKWNTINAFKIENIVDTAGAGDWCSAGIIDFLGEQASKVLLKGEKTKIEKALKNGQLLGALNCFFTGARGLMYSTDAKTLKASVSSKLRHPTAKLEFISKNSIRNDSEKKNKKTLSFSSLY